MIRRCSFQVCSFDIERVVVMVTFLPVKTYKKLAMNIVDSFKNDYDDFRLTDEESIHVLDK